MNRRSYTFGFGVGTFTMAIALMLNRYNTRSFPATEEVEPGFIAPSKLEIECKDLDGSGLPETVMRIDGRPHLLRYDAEGNPTLSKYEVRPAEVVPKE